MNSKIITKGKTLIKLKKIGFNVPKLKVYKVKEIKKNKSKIIKEILYFFKNSKVAIRSSAVGEDGNKSSMAGKYKSVLNVDLENLIIERSIDEVINSYKNNYHSNEVIVQEMVKNVRLSGVCTTINIHNYLPIIKIDYSLGSNTSLVTSGSSEKIKSLNILQSKNLKIKHIFVRKILNIIKKLKYFFKNKELDIEFAVNKKNQVYILQVRQVIIPPNKRIYNKKDLEKKIFNLKKKIIKIKKINYDLIGKTTFFGVMPDWNPAEIIGIKPKPLALNLYQELITDHIWSRQRTNYGFRNVESHHLMTTFYGTPFIDVRIDFNSWIPDKLNENISNKLVNFYLNKFKKNKYLHDKVEFNVLYTCFNFSSQKKIYKELGSKFNYKEKRLILNSLREITLRAIKNYKKEILLINKLIKKQNLIAQNYKIYPLNKIYYLIEDCKRYGTLPFAGLARCGFIAVDFLNSMVEEKIISLDDKNEFMSSINNVTSKMQDDLINISTKKFILKYGHLRPDTYEITSKNYREGFKEYFDKKSKTKISNYSSKKKAFSFNSKQKSKIIKFLKINKINVKYKDFINFIKDSIFLREYSKFIFTKSINLIFENLIEIGNKFKISRDDLSYLNLSTVLENHYNYSDLSLIKKFKKEINENKKIYYENSKIHLNSVICEPDDLYFFEEFKNIGNFVTRKQVHSKTYIYNKKFKNKDLKNNIILIQNADPGFDFLFSKNIKGLITKFGGQNSHMSIRAAELSIPACIGVGENKFEFLKTRKFLTLDCENKRIF